MAFSSTPEAAPSRKQVVSGILWMLLTGFLFVCVTGIVRYLGSDIPAVEAAFLRYVIGLFMVIPMALPLLKVRPSGILMGRYALRGFVHGGAVMLWFYAMARIPIAEVTALGYTAPFYVTLGAALFFGEKLHLRRLAALAVGFLGIVIILRPGFQEISFGQAAQLLAAPLFACSFLLAKGLTRDQNPGVMVFMLSLFCTITLLPGAIMQWRNPTWEELFWLTMTAAFATAGHYTLTRAFKAAPLTVTQPVTFLQLVWAALLGMTLFGEALDPFVFLGGGVVVASVTFISHREAQMAKREGQGKRAAEGNLETPPPVATNL